MRNISGVEAEYMRNKVTCGIQDTGIYLVRNKNQSARIERLRLQALNLPPGMANLYAEVYTMT